VCGSCPEFQINSLLLAAMGLFVFGIQMITQLLLDALHNQTLELLKEVTVFNQTVQFSRMKLFSADGLMV